MESRRYYLISNYGYRQRRCSPVQIMRAIFRTRLKWKASPFSVRAEDRNQHLSTRDEIDYFVFGSDINSNELDYKVCQQKALQRNLRGVRVTRLTAG